MSDTLGSLKCGTLQDELGLDHLLQETFFRCKIHYWNNLNRETVRF